MIPVIEVDGLSKRFDNFPAVDHLSFTVYRNEIFGLLGPNGAGKTTSISMICGLLPPSDGTVKIYNGKSSGPYSTRQNQKSFIGYCPQENIFYPRLTCLEQLVFIANMYGIDSIQARKRAHKLLELLGLADKSNTIASKLSGGMKRRLNICLALMHDPEILILDEPEAGLDPQSRLLVRDFIRDFGKEKAVILTTHNMDEADRLAQRIAIIDYGKLLLLDTPAQLKRTVGDGDLIELVFDTNEKSRIDSFISRASVMAEFISQDSYRVVFRHMAIMDLLGDFKIIAHDEGIGISEFKLRESTLEDVFIKLTGRNLRQ